jgi:colanic acid biosynthesis glycosyl transferase WcaI
VKILFITENYPPESNAAATRVSERAKYWLEQGHELTIITQAPNFPEGRLFDGYKNKWHQTETRDGVRVVRVKTYIAANAGFAKRIIDFTSLMFNAYWAALREERPDIVVATSPQFFAAVGGWAIAKTLRVPFIFELSDLWPASIRAVGAMETSRALDQVEKLELFLYRQSAAVIALTSSFKDDLISRGINPDKIHVVINGVDQARYTPQARSCELATEHGVGDRFVIGYIGTHGMAHALDNVLNAAELLRDRTDICILFVGSGSSRDALVADLAQRDLTNVVMVGRQPKERMPEYWSLCDVALIHLKDTPVFAGVIPSKIFEAMAMKLPMLFAGPKGIGSDIVEGEDVGVWVPPENPEALAKAIRAMADDPNATSAMAERSLAATPRFSRQRQAEEFMAVLENSVDRHTKETS